MPSSTDPLSQEPCKEHPVIGLRVLPDGPRYLFEALSSGDASKQLLTLGASDKSDIRIDDRYVSGTHCLLHWNRRRSAVFVHNAGRNGTRIDGMEVTASELREGSIMTVGTTHLIAFTRRTASQMQRVLIAGSNLREFVYRALAYYGGVRPTAYALGIARSTLRNWLERWELDD